MTIFERPVSRFCNAIFILLVTGSISAPASAQTSSIPDNAHAKSYGSGWECNLGFRAKDDTCSAVIVPDNAHPTDQPFGKGWECLHGYKEVDETNCIEVKLPKNAYLDADGNRWRCLRRYRAVDDGCEEIALPAHAYLTNDNYGPG